MTQPAAPRARRTQAERRATTRAALLNAAVELIARAGWEAATIEQIGTTAGVSKGAVMYHFRTKHELVEPVLALCVTDLRATAAAAWRREGPPGERLRAALRAMWQARRSGTPAALALLELLARAGYDPHVRPAVLAAYRAAERDLAEELEGAARALGLRPRAPAAALARVLLALLDGATLHARLHTEPRGDATGDDEALAAAEALALGVFTV